MLEPQITLNGNLGNAPTLRVVGNGSAVAEFRVACTPRRQDRATGEWSDAQTIWFGVTCWKALAENAAASLKKGDRVCVTGRLALHVWTGDDGVERTSYEVEATSLGVDLARGKVVIERPVRNPPAEQVWGSTGRVDDEGRAVLERVAGPLVPEQDADEAAA